MRTLKHFRAVAKNPKVREIRAATFEESEGEDGWFMVVLAEGCTLEGLDTFLVRNVTETYDRLREVFVLEVKS